MSDYEPTGNRSTEPTRTHDRTVVHHAPDREDVELREIYGGVHWGCAFFGWLTAMGTGLLLTAVLTSIGAAVGLSVFTAQEAGSEVRRNAEAVGLVGGIVLLVILFIAYFCGGYVAGRMARFDGAKQGLAVWAWALIAAIVVAVLAAIAGSQYNVLFELNGFPRIPVREGQLTTGGLIAAIAALVVTLGGAVVGGVAGTRFHRRVDEARLVHSK